MSRGRCICLHKDEWDRLKRQAGTHDCVENPQENLNQKLIEQSQEWIKKWPTSEQAQIANHEAKKLEKRKKEIEAVEAYRQKQKTKPRVNVDVLQKARQMIFNDSCYGKELLSSLRYSKVREEVKKQMKLKQFIKEETARHNQALEGKIAAMSDNIYDLRSRDQEREAKVRQIDDERRIHNKMMFEARKAQNEEEDREEKLGALEDARLMKQYLDFEAHETDHCKQVIASEIEQFHIDHRKNREASRKRDELDTAIVDVWRRHNNRVKHRTEKVLEELHQERHDNPLKRNAYESIRIALEKEEKLYNDFIDKGVQQYEEKCLKKEEKEKVDEINRKEKLLKLAKEYKGTVKKSNIEDRKNCAFESYSLLPQKKPCKKISEKDKDQLPFLKECTTLRDALEKRSKEPTPWNALESSHKYFAEQAEAILAECKYKKMARKVVDVYRKNNCLDENKLPIANYK